MWYDWDVDVFSRALFILDSFVHDILVRVLPSPAYGISTWETPPMGDPD